MCRWAPVVAVILAAACAAGCARQDDSPRIVCEVKGGFYRTPFTFAEFRRLLEEEHGSVSAQEGEYLKTPSLEVRFEPRPDGTLLAVHIAAAGVSEPIDPAYFFGLSDEGAPVLALPTNGSPFDVPFTNVAAAAGEP